MKSTSKNSQSDKYRLKTSPSPISGINTYSVFKNGTPVLMVDGERASVFKPEEVEMISFSDNPDSWIVRVGNLAFTRCATLTKEQRKKIPKGCELIQAL